MVRHLGTLETRDNDGNLKRVEVIATERPKRKDSNFMKVYDEGLIAIARNQALKPASLRLYLHLLSIAGFENWLDFNQTKLAKELGMTRVTLNRAVKNLLDEKFLIKDAPKQGWKQMYRINPHVAYRGSAASRTQAITRTRAVKPKLALIHNT